MSDKGVCVEEGVLCGGHGQGRKEDCYNGEKSQNSETEDEQVSRRNKRLGVFDVMKEIREDMSSRGDLISNVTSFRRQGDGKRGATAMRIMGSNKRFKPDD